MSVTVGSCSSTGEPDFPDTPDRPGSSKSVCFKFKIYTDDTPARSRALGVWEETPANVAERILDPNDMRVLLLNAAGYLIRSVKPTALEYHDGGIYGDGYYSLSIFFEDDFIDKLDDNTMMTFQVLVLANINSIGGVYTSDALLPNTHINSIQETFVMSPDWFPSPTKGIPMYGLNTSVQIRKADIIDGATTTVGEINMLRAMAKIEVKDAVSNAYIADGKKYPYVDHVEMISWRDHGYLKQPYTDYADGLRIAYPHPDGYSTTPVTATFMDDKGNGDGVFRFYCPENALDKTAFRVYAVLAPGTEPRPFDVSLGQYADNGSVFGTDLVRNHIYRFNVNSFGTMADVDVIVSEWGHQVDEYELGNIVSMDDDGFLQWTDLSDDFSVSATKYNGEDEQMLSMLNSTTDYATGTFHIVSPLGATWRAYFVPGENGVDAFEFVDVDAAGNVVEGSARSFAEGTVGDRATIHIRGKGPADIYRHYAELVVEVRTADGVILPAYLTPALSTRFIIYRENKL